MGLGEEGKPVPYCGVKVHRAGEVPLHGEQHHAIVVVRHDREVVPSVDDQRRFVDPVIREVLPVYGDESNKVGGVEG